jgi:transposase
MTTFGRTGGIMEAYEIFVGVDWGTESHQVCVMSKEGTQVSERQVTHSGPGLQELVEWLRKHSGNRPDAVAVAVETPRGALVETLLEGAFHVYAINPKQLDRFRDRHTVAGAKDDSRDAYVLADSVRTDRKLFRHVTMDDPIVVRLRELSRMDAELDNEFGRLTNQVRSVIHRYFPQLLRLCPAADEPWLWALLTRAPTPAAAAKLRRVELQRLLRAHRIRRFDVDTLAALLREPAVTVAPGTSEAASEHLGMLLPRVSLVGEQRRDCLRRIDRALDGIEASADPDKQEHRVDLRILRSQPGLGRQGIAAMLAEAWLPLRERDYHTLRCQAGIAPVTRQTGVQGKRRGKNPQVLMRRAVNPRLREALWHWSRVACQGTDPRAAAHYSALRQRGHNHARALRGVADRLLSRLTVMLSNRTVYDPAHVTSVQVSAHNA